MKDGFSRAEVDREIEKTPQIRKIRHIKECPKDLLHTIINNCYWLFYEIRKLLV